MTVKRIKPKEIFIKVVILGKCKVSDFELLIFCFSNTNFLLKNGVKIKEPIINHVKVNFFEYLLKLGTNYWNKF